MPGFMDNYVFGGAKVDFAGQDTAKELFIGATFANASQIKTTAAAAKGLDYGTNEGYYKQYAAVRVQRMDKFDAEVGSVEITLYDSEDNATFTQAAKLFLRASDLDGANRTPVLMVVPSTVKRYVAMSIKFNVASGKTLAKLTKGSLLAQITPTRW